MPSHKAFSPIRKNSEALTPLACSELIWWAVWPYGYISVIDISAITMWLKRHSCTGLGSCYQPVSSGLRALFFRARSSPLAPLVIVCIIFVKHEHQNSINSLVKQTFTDKQLTLTDPLLYFILILNLRSHSHWFIIFIACFIFHCLLGIPLYNKLFLLKNDDVLHWNGSGFLSKSSFLERLESI